MVNMSRTGALGRIILAKMCRTGGVMAHLVLNIDGFAFQSADYIAPSQWTQASKRKIRTRGRHIRIMLSYSHTRILSYYHSLLLSSSRTLMPSCSFAFMLPGSRALVRLRLDGFKISCVHTLKLSCSHSLVLSCSHAVIRLQIIL